MSATLFPRHIDLYRKTLTGEHRLIGWGIRDAFYFQRWQEQYPLECFVDANYKTWDTRVGGYDVYNPMSLRDYSAKDTSVIDYFRMNWVTDYVRRMGKMDVLPPLPLQHIMRALACGHTKPPVRLVPMPKQTWQKLNKKLARHLMNFNFIPGWKGMGATANFDRNLTLLGGYHWTECVAGIAASIPTQESAEQTVILVGDSLFPGGAERQMVNLAVGFRKRGWKTHSLPIAFEPRFTIVMRGGARRIENAPHYINLLQEHGITIHDVLDGVNEAGEEAFMRDFLKSQTSEVRLALWHLPVEVILQVASAIRLFQQVKPKLVVAYLDLASVAAGIAALLCGVPHIVVSGRNYPPSYFPHFFENMTEVFHSLYQVLLTNPRVSFTNNSSLAGAAYAKWLGIKSSRIAWVPNCLASEFMSQPSSRAIGAIKRKFNIKPSDKIVLGVFRLSPEKRPEKFLSVIATLIKNDKNVRAIICGDGSMRTAMEQLVIKKKIAQHVVFVGITEEIRTIMRTSHILLHTAAFEGMPNVILEAQSQGLPVVCMRTGGVADCLAPVLAPYGFGKNDWKGLTKAARLLLHNNKLRHGLGLSAQKFVRREFSVSRLIERTLTNGGLPASLKVSSSRRS